MDTEDGVEYQEEAEEEEDKENGSSSPAQQPQHRTPPGLPIFTTANSKPLDVETVVDILKNVDKYESIACDTIPSDPKPGNVFLFVPKNELQQAISRRDQYLWVNHGPKSIPARGPLIQKRYFVAKLPDGRPSKFHKSIYTLIHDIRILKPCIVQYMGSMDGITVLSKRSRGHDRSSLDSPSNKKWRSSSIFARSVVMQPQRLPISRDDFKQLHELAYSLHGFINTLQISPTFQCVISVKDLSDHLEAVLKANIDRNEPILFSYCTSYEVGGLVLSPLLFSHIAFDGKPAIPSHFILHEKDDTTVHQEFFRIISEQIPSLKMVEAPIVTEADPLKDGSLEDAGLKLTPLSSWKGIMAEVKEWLYANDATQQEVATGLDDIRKLMSNPSIEEYEEAFDRCKEHWGEALQEYYITDIDPSVRSRYGRWVIDKWGVFNPYTGVSDSRSDCLEAVMQHLNTIVNVSAYTTALSCYLLQQFVKKEIKDGIHGIGRYVPRDNFALFKENIANWKPIPFLCPPDSIVNYIKNDQLVVQDGSLIERAEVDAKKTLLSKGKQIYENGGVHHNSSIQAFVVKEWERPDESFLVKLHPRATCSCDSAMFCQHIIAVKISIGVDMESEMERLDSKFVTRALKSCENAAEGIKPKRKRRKRRTADLAAFGTEVIRKREYSSRGEPFSDGDEGESENDSEVTGNGQSGSQVDFFPGSGQISYNITFE